ncbi:PAS domain-containing protein [Candidatus Omnitrophota bacterium]
MAENAENKKLLLERTINSFSVPFYLIGLDYKIVLVNDAARKKGIAEGSYCYKVTHREEKPCKGKHPCPMREVISLKKPVQMEHIHYDEQGKERIVEVHGDPIFDESGNVIQMIEYVLDITERKEAEKELRKKMHDLEIYYKSTVNRELKMVDLKKEVNALLEELEKPTKYGV